MTLYSLDDSLNTDPECCRRIRQPVPGKGSAMDFSEMDFGDGSESLHRPPRSIDLAVSPHAWRQARSFLEDAIGDRRPPEQVQLAALLTTEILSMAARFTVHTFAKPIRVTTSAAKDRLRVTVRDREASLSLAITSDANQDAWGLLVIEKMSARWGTEQSLVGTYIWFEL
jgi:hypothetical protein